MSTCRRLVRSLDVACGPCMSSNGAGCFGWIAHEGRSVAAALWFSRKPSTRNFTITSRLRVQQTPIRPQQQRRRQQQQQQQWKKPTPGQEAESLTTLFEKNKFPLIASGIAAAVMGGYIVLLIISITSAPEGCEGDDRSPSGRPLDLRQGRISATAFDRDLNRPESLTGIKGLRQQMGRLARGHVLEVAVGTGRNIEYIDWDEIRATAPPVATDTGHAVKEVKSEEQLAREKKLRRIKKVTAGEVLASDEAPEVLSYTGVDISTDVLEVAWMKLRKAVPELVPRRKRQSKEEGEAQQPVQRQEDDQQSGATKSWLRKTTTAVIPTSSSSITAIPPSSTTTSPLVIDGDLTLAANIGQGRIRLYKSDAQTRLPPPPAMSSCDGTKILPAPAYYDTILQNFGLCSVSDPQQMIANMAAVLRPDSGRIYLLEHGRGWFDWLNGLLDKFAPAHFRRYGCWWNRDIKAIILEAEKEVPGLELVKIESPLVRHAGTLTWIEMRVNPNKGSKSDTEVGLD